jgi:hypothetical protein
MNRKTIAAYAMSFNGARIENLPPLISAGLCNTQAQPNVIDHPI